MPLVDRAPSVKYKRAKLREKPNVISLEGSRVGLTSCYIIELTASRTVCQIILWGLKNDVAHEGEKEDFQVENRPNCKGCPKQTSGRASRLQARMKECVGRLVASGNQSS